MKMHFDDRKYINRDTYLRYANTNEEFLTHVLLPARQTIGKEEYEIVYGAEAV